MTTLSRIQREAIAWVREHPGATAKEVAAGIFISGVYAQEVLLALFRASMLSRERRGAYRYYRRER
jgi:hypothetical protein